MNQQIILGLFKDLDVGYFKLQSMVGTMTDACGSYQRGESDRGLVNPLCLQLKGVSPGMHIVCTYRAPSLSP